MNRMVFTLILMIALMPVLAQEVTPWQFVRHSAPDANNQIHVRFNGSATITGDYELFNWQNNAWQAYTPVQSEDYIYEALIPHQNGQSHSYRLRNAYQAAGENIVAMNPAYFGTDTFPPALASLAYVADDPVGDSVMVYYPNLDITGTWTAYSENKIYAAISDQTNTFPTMNSLSSYNLYFAGLLNAATAITDSTIYAMVYTFSIPGVISPGLYKLGVDGTTPTFTRLGNIQSQVVSGKLMMSCNISDLVADPTFGEWPPMFNMMGYVCGSMRIDLDLQSMTPTFNFGDYSALAQLVFEAYTYPAQTNQPPVISDVVLAPGPVTRNLTFTYSDPNQDFPLTAKIVLDNGNEINALPTSFVFTSPVQFTALLPAANWTNAEIRISDNDITFVTHPLSSVANQDDFLPVTPVVSVYPNPYRASGDMLNISLNTDKVISSAGIYNAKGQCIRHLDVNSPDTDFAAYWDGSTDNNNPAADGIYFIKLQYGSRMLSKKIIVIR